MEAFESFVALALEAEDFVVAGPVKFLIKQKTKKKSFDEFQTHGYEVDLVAARADKLVLASVKGFFGSGGVRPKDVIDAESANASGYKMLNNLFLRSELIKQAAAKYGYRVNQVEIRLYGGIFKDGLKGLELIRQWGAKQNAGGGGITVHSGAEVAAVVAGMATSGTYRDHEVIMALKVLLAADMLKMPDKAAKAETDKAVAGKHAPLDAEVRRLPVGTKVQSSTDALIGVVLGHKQDAGKAVYVRLWVGETETMHLRSASTLHPQSLEDPR